MEIKLDGEDYYVVSHLDLTDRWGEDQRFVSIDEAIKWAAKRARQRDCRHVVIRCNGWEVMSF